MPEREVKQVLASYIDEDGAMRYALAGERVSVHADHVEAFDGAQEEEASAPKAPAPKRKPRKA